MDGDTRAPEYKNADPQTAQQPVAPAARVGHIFGSLPPHPPRPFRWRRHGVACDSRSRGRMNQPTQKSMRGQDFEARIDAGREWKFRRVPHRFRFVLMGHYDNPAA
jgi:hypothetical protein